MSADFRSEVLVLLSRLKEKHSALHAQLQAVEREMEAVNITARLLGSAASASGQPAFGTEIESVKIEELTGKSSREALLMLAKQADGRVRIADVKGILVAAGILRPTKNLWGAIYTTLVRSPEFQKLDGEKGVFVLRDSGQQVLP